MIIGSLKTSTSKRRYRKDKREIQLIHSKTSQLLRWSEQLITLSRADHWVHIPDPGSYLLIIEPIVEGALLPQTLIDGGSGLNVIFVDTLKKMDFDSKRLTACNEPFFGIIPSQWRMCIDYTDLNKHCPKDPFPISCIDQVADSTA
jgi:hypothetical protein